MTTLRRIVKLERQAGNVKKYFCVVGLPKQNGFKVQPMGAGEEFTLKTREELNSFGDRPDVELTQIDVIYRDVKGGE
jgi:hypothetical protein